LWFRSRINNL